MNKKGKKVVQRTEFSLKWSRNKSKIIFQIWLEKIKTKDLEDLWVLKRKNNSDIKIFKKIMYLKWTIHHIQRKKGRKSQ